MLFANSISSVGRKSRHGGSLVSARVGLRSLWFHSHDVPLRPSVEGFCGAAWCAAMMRGQTLRAPFVVDPVWWRNIQQLIPWWREKWGYEATPPRGMRPAEAPRPAPTRGGAGLFFTCGVDSFFSLLEGPIRPAALIFVHGYDVPLRDRERAQTVVAAVTAVADALGLETLILRTNFRKHPVMKRARWDKVHGAALAAAAHVLSERLDVALISAGLEPGLAIGSGSHWHSDPLWSSSDLELRHVGAEHSRMSKVRAIAAHPLVQRHLRVCWQNRGALMNCSECDKCVTTMVLLEQCGWLPAFKTFDLGAALPERLSRLPETRYICCYRQLAKLDLGKPLNAAIRSLLDRSPESGY